MSAPDAPVCRIPENAPTKLTPTSNLRNADSDADSDSATDSDSDSDTLRHRLFKRIAQSAAAARVFTTVRPARLALVVLAPGVSSRELYRAKCDSVPRPGEPGCVQLIELSPGARWAGADAQVLMQRECLVLRGDLQPGSERLGARDFFVVPAGWPLGELSSEFGALLYWRTAPVAALPGETPRTVLDSTAGWADYVPGIKRRLLWQRGPLAAMLYLAEPGAAVPRHRHGHDEECLMVEGDVFLDDVLLRTGDWQLAPAGSGHEGVCTDTGGVLYAHGDIDLEVRG